MSAYARGVQLEHDFYHHATKLGYFAIRSAGSKGPADLVIICPDHIHFVEVKRWKDHRGALAQGIEYLATLAAKLEYATLRWNWTLLIKTPQGVMYLHYNQHIAPTCFFSAAL